MPATDSAQPTPASAASPGSGPSGVAATTTSAVSTTVSTVKEAAAAALDAATPTLSARARARLRRRRAKVERAAKRINENRALRVAARVGLSINAVVHVLIGAFAVGVVFGLGEDASQNGALHTIAASPGGYLILWVGAVALWALAVWQLTEAAWVTAPKRRLRVTRRLGNVGRAISFAALGGATALSASGLPVAGETSEYEIGEALLGTPLGAFLLIVAGGTILTLGITSIFRGCSRNFRQENADLDGFVGRTVDVLGIFGYVAKGFALVVVGALAMLAAIFTDPSQVVGLDGALDYLNALPFGTTMSVTVGVGFIAYGLYLVARAIYLRTEPDDTDS